MEEFEIIGQNQENRFKIGFKSDSVLTDPLVVMSPVKAKNGLIHAVYNTTIV